MMLRALSLLLLVAAAAAAAQGKAKELAEAPAPMQAIVQEEVSSKKAAKKWNVTDYGTGKGIEADCDPTSSTSLGDSWKEITQTMNYTQYSSVPGADLSGLPDPLPFPWAVTASDNKAPGWVSVCFAESPSAPEGCTGDACDVYLEEWGVKWLEFAILDCAGSWPTPGLVNFITNPNPPAGQVGPSVTQTCKNYWYSSESGWDFFYSLTDSFGQKWALQTVPKNLTTEEEFDDWLAQAQYPEGFSLEKIPLNETGMIHPPYVVGESCYSMVVKDNLFNSYHLWQYPEGGITRNNSMIGQMGKNCEHLTAQYTLEGMEAMAPAPAPAPATATDAPAPTPVSGAATLRASAALLAAAVAAALLF